MKALSLLFLLVAGCTHPEYSSAQVERPLPQAPPAEKSQTETSHLPEATPPSPIIAISNVATSSAEAPVAKTFTLDGITFHAVIFDSRTHSLKVADQPQGPGSLYRDAKQAMSATKNGLAAINAGFFTPEGKTLGFVVSEGTTIGKRNSSSLGAGVYQNKSGKQSLIRRQSYTNANVTEALQSGPFLVWKGAPPKGLSQERPRVRSIVLTDGKTQWAIAQTSSATLADLGKVLATHSFEGWNVQSVLNLDGGRSCDLYTAPTISGGGHQHRSFIAKPVRNFLVLVPR